MLSIGYEMVTAGDISSYIHTYKLRGGASGLMFIVVGSGQGDASSNPGRIDCIAHSINIIEKGMNPIILFPALGK